MGRDECRWEGNRLSKVFDRGDIVRVCLNPTVGKEQQGDARPALVISPKVFNSLGLTLIAPISQGGDFARYAGFAVTLMGSGSRTQGVVLANMLRSVDLHARGAKLVEKVDMGIVAEVVARLTPVLEF
jgi:mRNA interferase ChpB